ncbi:hypothetical protein Rs2_52700 [Raphanus sativus]|nr:hypothetical protein Rs2_52700 [Raphanus sativus]
MASSPQTLLQMPLKLIDVEIPLLHGVDAAKLLYITSSSLTAEDSTESSFNFSHAGFQDKETDSGLTETGAVLKHIDLVFRFLNGATHLVRGDGRIHVSHKEKSPFYHWTLEEIADRCSLVLKQCVAFEKSEYTGYEKEGMF